MPNVTITITPGNGVQSAVVHIDDTDVSRGGNFNLVTGSHSLHWWFAGNSGCTLAITVSPLSDGTALRLADVVSPPEMFEAGDKTFAV